MSGKLKVIFGPMFSGKTAELIRYLTEEVSAHRLVHAFHPRLDVRAPYSMIESHCGMSFPASSVVSGDEESMWVWATHVGASFAVARRDGRTGAGWRVHDV